MVESAWLTRFRFVFQASIDVAAWMAAVAVATWLRYEFDVDSELYLPIVQVGAIAAAMQIGFGRWRGLYVHRWRYGTLEEVMNTAATVVVAAVVAGMVNGFALDPRLPIGAAMLAAPLALGSMAVPRFAFRLMLEQARRPEAEGAKRVVILGAGDGGEQVVRAMLGDRNSPYLPVALLDDSPALRNLQIKGVSVRGGREQLAEVAAETGADTLLVAIPSASGELLRELVPVADALGLRMLVLPPVSELFGVGIGVGDIRAVTEADLLGRREIETDLAAVSHYITGRRVLVTGAGGSIGSELCRHLHRFAPAALIMLDRDESALHGVQLSIEGRALLDNDQLVVADIRDAERLHEVFQRHRPDVVFHAAALKHLSLLEMHASEGFKTNVLGTQNVLDAAQRCDVSHFVNISTDKAADASSVLGRTKRLAEQLTAFAGLQSSGSYTSVRFGNVLGSRGSVLPLFRAQIEAGGPLTVTHPDVTRFFMTIPEACELVIQAGALGESGQVMVLDMGEPVRIDDLARRLIAESDRAVEIVYTGLRPGEKLNEVLFGEDEPHYPSTHPLISCVAVPPIDPRRLRETEDDVVDLRDRRNVDVDAQRSLFFDAG